ncbi:glycoside hydrolase family 30 protein [Sodalis sp. RH21]|uniref:glycoside hydrolase family 30 protein n=1 Tax=unclassified Sodalis (in: enterobacteria) TaxID=2636512 RepID=UPI0039B41FBD
MRKYICIMAAVMSGLATLASHAATIEWFQSGYDKHTNTVIEWKAMNSPALEKFDNSDYRVLSINQKDMLQEIDGFGAAFNEKGWDALSGLSQTEHAKVLTSLFASHNGLNLTLGRIPIGANDFSMDYYSLDDHPADYEMKHFSIARDEKYLIPFIKAALAYQPDMQFFASPWTPPAWMKANNYYGCRGSEGRAHLVWEPKIEQAYALYLSKFVQAYQEKGINISAVHLQNEPAACQDFPSSTWTGLQMRDFLRDYLIPQFEKDKLPATAWLGTINYGDYESYAKPVLEDKALRGKLGGVGYQWDGKYAIEETRKRYPGTKLIQTESECGNGSNDLFAGFYTFNLIKKYLEAGASQYYYWNMVLDSSGNSSWGWKQNSLISVDRMYGKVSYNFEYYVLKHVSALVRPKAHLLNMKNDEDALAFINTDNSIVLVLANPSYSEKQMRITLGDKMIRVKMPMLTMNSLVINL